MAGDEPGCVNAEKVRLSITKTSLASGTVNELYSSSNRRKSPGHLVIRYRLPFMADTQPEYRSTLRHTYKLSVIASWGAYSSEPKEFTIKIAGGLGIDTPKNCWMEFDIRGRKSNPPQPLDYTFMNKAGTCYGFRCCINSAQMADPITATLHYGSSKINGWTIGKEYLFMDKAEELTGSDEEAAREGLKSYALSMKGSVDASLAFILTLESQTIINLKARPASGYSGKDLCDIHSVRFVTDGKEATVVCLLWLSLTVL